MLSIAYDWSYFDVCLDNMLFTKNIVLESLTGWLGWQFNSNFVLDKCREWDLSFLWIEKPVSNLFEVKGAYCLRSDSITKRREDYFSVDLNNRKFFSDDFFSPKLNLRGKMNPKFSSVFVFKYYLSHMTDRLLTYGCKTRFLQKLLSMRASLVC